MEVNTWKIEDFTNKELDHSIASRASQKDTKKSFFDLCITRVKKERGDGGIVGVRELN